MWSAKSAERSDIIIVGNGALGLFLADEISRRWNGRRVTVVGQGARPGGASQAAGAMLGCFCEVTADTLRTEQGRKRFEIGLNAHALWEKALKRLEKRLPAGHQLKTASETHVILNSVGSHFDSTNFEAMTKALTEYDQAWSEVDPGSIDGYAPKPDCRSFRAIRLPSEGAVDARGVLASLELELAENGVEIIDATVQKVQTYNGAVVGVELDDGRTIEAETVVIAAGAASESLVSSSSEDIDLVATFPGLGLGMIVKRQSGQPFKSVVRTPNRGFACGLHVVPGPDGTEYLGSTNRLVPEMAYGACFEDMSYFTRSAMQQLDEDIATHEVLRLLVGNRPVTLDGFPLLGKLPVVGLFLMTGTFRDGLHCAPQLALDMADEIEGVSDGKNLEFAPTRSPISTRTVEASVDEFLLHSEAMWYESAADAPLSTRDMIAYRKDQALRLYDYLGVDFGLNPEVLWYAVRFPVGAERIKSALSSKISRGKSLTDAKVAALA